MSRLAIFIPDLQGGGAEKMMVHLANEFAVLGHDCKLVLAQASGPYLSLVDDAVAVVDLQTNFNNPLIILRLAHYLRHNRPDALLSAMTYPNIAALLARRLARIPLRAVISERTTMTIQSGNTPGMCEKLKPFAARRLYRQADRIVAISEGVARNLKETLDTGPQQIVTIYNPVITEREQQQYPVPDHPWLQDHSQPVLLSAGRLVNAKDYPTLLQAFARVREQLPARLIILGEGPEREHLQALIRQLSIDDACDLPGRCDDLYAYMQHADLFVLSSAWEGFGNVLVEALANGCPVVSTDCPGGPAEILDQGRYGRLAPVGQPATLAAAITDSLQETPNRGRLRERAGHFSAAAIAQKYLEVLLPG